MKFAHSESNTIINHGLIAGDQMLKDLGNGDMKSLGDQEDGTMDTGFSGMSLSDTLTTSSDEDKYRQGQIVSGRFRQRIILKDGNLNVMFSHVKKRRRRYLADIFTTLVDVQWRWTLLLFACSFFLSWLGFAIIWWLILLTHGDLEPENVDNGDWSPCVVAIKDFTSVFLFSIETQHTIGYGSRSTTEECPEAVFLMGVQSVVGVMIQAFMVGIVFSKLARPTKRKETLLFSRNAVICQRDGELCLLFRVGDMRKTFIVEAHIRAQLMRKRVTREGELISYSPEELNVQVEGGDDRMFFIWPLTIVHKINSDSPLYNISASDLMHEKFEIMVILEGVNESTGNTSQARSSYLPNEVLWGHRFEPLVNYKKDTGMYEVDYTRFHHTYEIDTPLCSARDLEQFYKNHEENLFNNKDVTSPSLVQSAGTSSRSSDILVPDPVVSK